MSKERYEQWGFESYKDNETGVINSDFLEVMNQQDQQIADLEAKLAEKEKEIEKLNKRIEKQVDNGYKIIQNCKEIQKQAIIEQLEKVKRHIIEDTVWELTYEDVLEIIDNRIEELKKEMK